MAPYTKIFQSGFVFFYENDRSREMYIIVRGKVRVYRTEKGQKVEISELGKGGIVGEMSLLDGRARSATVEAMEETEVSVITPEEFERKSHLIPEWFLSIIRILCARLREVDRKLKGSLDEEIAANVASLISMMMNKKKTAEESHLDADTLDLKRAKTETMEILSLTHDRVAAALRELEGNGLIVLGNNVLKVPDKQSLVLYSKYKRGIELDHDMEMGRPLSANATLVLKLLYGATKTSKTDKNGECELNFSALGAEADKLFSEGEFLKELMVMNVVAYDEKKLLESKPREMGKITVNRRKIASILASVLFGNKAKEVA
jgi:CRP/FNR family transcriptional regulator, cyclic AMP receptor protein